MSTPSYFTKSYGHSTRLLGSNQVLKPFEVIDAGDSKVAINIGSIIVGSNGSYVLPEAAWYGSAKPQDIIKNGIDPSLLLGVQQGDFICIIISNILTGQPRVSIEAININDIANDQYKRLEKRIVRLGYVHGTLGSGSSITLDIVDLYIGNVATEIDNLPSFTPIVWGVEQDFHNLPETWRCVFKPGYIYNIGSTEKLPYPIKINGEDMDTYPVQDNVQAGDKWGVYYKIDKTTLKVKDCEFKKMPPDGSEEYIKPIGVEPKNKDYIFPIEDEEEADPPESCTGLQRDGEYIVQIVEFLESEGALIPKMFMKSDICITLVQPCYQADLWFLDKTGAPKVARFDISNVRTPTEEE